MLQFWSYGECGEPLHCHYSQVHSEVVALIRVPSVSQVEIFNNFLFLKTFNSVQKNDWC